MKRTIEINYNYDTSELSHEEKANHTGEMEDNAMGHILEMVLEGYISGGLCYGFRRNPFNEDKDVEWPIVEVHGDWSCKSINKDSE